MYSNAWDFLPVKWSSPVFVLYVTSSTQHTELPSSFLCLIFQQELGFLSLGAVDILDAEAVLSLWDV